jgi:hypothetical protein
LALDDVGSFLVGSLLAFSPDFAEAAFFESVFRIALESLRDLIVGGS